MISIEQQYQDEINDLKAQLKLAEEKLAQFEIEWDGEKYVFTPKAGAEPAHDPYSHSAPDRTLTPGQRSSAFPADDAKAGA